MRWLVDGKKGMHLLPSLKGGALEVAFYIRGNRAFVHLPFWLESHSVSLLVSEHYNSRNDSLGDILMTMFVLTKQLLP